MYEITYMYLHMLSYSRIFVDVDAYPKAKHTWYFNGKEIRTSHKYVLVDEARRLTLRILDVQPEDSGHYTIRLENEFGDATCTTTLNILREFLVHNC